ncbi:hypothetical protein SERLA73DRAFT_74815 [Serpula lacrymans var. lacrymans S7.3]|uniref:Uncharacterized protein n=2 Tax=Serpula lacrymans var. lacrymans TaxID=341189 RepID=F8Q3L6_SERL3|nr:uncharacterized protein SERLADRAFT_439487 [Serpula lacrymans var. lacrymans S7.9]EGN97101.1 hypothetical protein SERLA73DRAFT_74815 [Serpula lacrymans var. lacrymans S7.3]EGO22707.1 hypothetical protein SERLADRAFT_439487 [Serpula lacrymans var. lacrymans S7.9]
MLPPQHDTLHLLVLIPPPSQSACGLEMGFKIIPLDTRWTSTSSTRTSWRIGNGDYASDAAIMKLNA